MAVDLEESKVMNYNKTTTNNYQDTYSQNNSPVKLSQFVCESPQKLSAMKASLALKQESVEKEIDSILGDSPSPSKQVERNGWSIISPQKFALRLDNIPAKVVEVNAEQNSRSEPTEEDMSSHDLTQEEEEKD